MPTDIWDAIETRGVLEGTAVRLAAERLADPRALEPLSRINLEIGEIVRMDTEGFGRYLELNEAFHSAIIDLSCSRVLRRAVENVYSLPFAAPSAFLLLGRNLPEGKEMVAVALDITEPWLKPSDTAKARAQRLSHANIHALTGAIWNLLSPTATSWKAFPAPRSCVSPGHAKRRDVLKEQYSLPP